MDTEGRYSYSLQGNQGVARMTALLISLALIGNQPENPAIYIVVADHQEKSKFAIADLNRDFSQINPRVVLSPIEQVRHHAKVRRINRIRSEIASKIILVDDDNLPEPLKEYPQYKMGPRGKWYPFPKQAFVANGWFLLTVARISDEWNYNDKHMKFKKTSAKDFIAINDKWKDCIHKYMKEQIDKKNNTEAALKCIVDVVDCYVWYTYENDNGEFYLDCSSIENTNYGCKTLNEIYYEYVKTFPDMPFFALFCPKFPPKTYLPYEFDIYKHEGFKLKTEESYGTDD